jgi:hypothetical protein
VEHIILAHSHSKTTPLLVMKKAPAGSGSLHERAPLPGN